MADEKPKDFLAGWEEAKNWLRRLDPSQRMLVPLILAAGLGLLLLRGDNPAGAGIPGKSEAGPVPEEQALSREEGDWTEEQWEQELARSLSRIKGVGKVWIELTLEGTEVRVWQEKEEDETRQVQEEGPAGRRERQNRINRDLVFSRENGGEKPVLRQKRRPKVLGALVIAEGAGDPVVREELWQAAAVATGAELHRITVVSGEEQ